MVRDFRYIVKRVISAVLIAICLYFLRSYLFINVLALGVTSHNVGGEDVVIDNTTLEVSHTVSDNPWANWRYGYLYFDFSINKVNGTSTSSLVFPRSATACSDTVCYLCSIGSSSTNNATYDSSVFSAKCPMDMGASGLTSVKIQFNDFQNNNPSQYRFRMGGLMTFEQISETSIDISSINQQTQQQMANDNQNTQDIIDNQNQNTQDIIDSNKVCTVYDKNSIFHSNTILNSNGTESSSQNFGVSDFLLIESSSIERIVTTTYNAYTCFYNINKSFISCVSNQNVAAGSVSIPSNASYVKFTINSNYNAPQFKVCRNGNQAIADSQQEINNTLNDSSSVGSADIDSFFGDIDESSDTPISDLITMPLTLLTAYSNGFSGTCSSWNLGNLYGTDLVMPCIHVSNYLGNDLWHIIDLCFSLYMIYNLAMLCVMIFEDITSLRDDMLSLYTPQHAYTGYQPKHGSD